jgi:Tfp pilus assembly protein PilN
MRLDINLATHPYEDSREFWSRWGLGVAVLGVLTLALLGFVVQGWISAGRDRHDIAQLQDQIVQRDKERAQAQAFLNMAVNHSTREQSQFLNGLIQRKSFSWTRVFEDLEQVMPPNLHVASLRPELTEQNQMQLDMRVMGNSRSAAVELVHRMEGSRHFRDAQLVAETLSGESGTTIVASVTAIYVPDSVGKSADKGADRGADKSSDTADKSLTERSAK